MKTTFFRGLGVLKIHYSALRHAICTIHLFTILKTQQWKIDKNPVRLFIECSVLNLLRQHFAPKQCKQ